MLGLRKGSHETYIRTKKSNAQIIAPTMAIDTKSSFNIPVFDDSPKNMNTEMIEPPVERTQNLPPSNHGILPLVRPAMRTSGFNSMQKMY